MRDFSRPADTCEIFPLACRRYTDVQLRLLILIDDLLEMSEMSSILLEMDLFPSQSPIQWHIDIVVVELLRFPSIHNNNDNIYIQQAMDNCPPTLRRQHSTSAAI